MDNDIEPRRHHKLNSNNLKRHACKSNKKKKTKQNTTTKKHTHKKHSHIVNRNRFISCTNTVVC